MFVNTLSNEEMTKIKVGDLGELSTFIFITFTANHLVVENQV